MISYLFSNNNSDILWITLPQNFWIIHGIVLFNWFTKRNARSRWHLCFNVSSNYGAVAWKIFPFTCTWYMLQHVWMEDWRLWFHWKIVILIIITTVTKNILVVINAAPIPCITAINFHVTASVYQRPRPMWEVTSWHLLWLLISITQ